MDCSRPDFPVLHCLPEFAQTHVHWVGDATQPSHLAMWHGLYFCEPLEKHTELVRGIPWLSSG